MKEKRGIGRRSFLLKTASAVSALAFPKTDFAEKLASGNGGATRGREPGEDAYWEMIRSQFLLTDERVYFNNGGLGPSPRRVIDAVHEATLALEEISETGHEKLERVREDAAAFLGCDPDEIAFTRSTTEGMNYVARGLDLRAGDEVLMSTHEHPGGAMPWVALKDERGIRIRLFEPATTAEENYDRIARSIGPRTRVLMISHMTCTTGTVFPVFEIAALCDRKGIFFVLDGAHPPGQMPLNLRDTGAHFYATSGHKWLLGPKGTGLLYIRKDLHEHWRPTFVGAYSAEYDLDKLLYSPLKRASTVEYGTRNSPLVLGLGEAMNFLREIGLENIRRHNLELCDILVQNLHELPGLRVLTPDELRSRGSIVTFKPLKLTMQETIERLAQRGFRLRPVGEHGLNAIRVSCHVYNNREQVEALALELRKLFAS